MTTILVIEDEPPVRNLIRDVLLDEGYHVVVAGDGREGLGVLKTVVADLILCDVMMPRMDGVAFAAALREHPRWQYVPLIMMSAANQVGRLPAGLFTAFLPKPFQLDALLSLVETTLGDGGDSSSFPFEGNGPRVISSA